MQVRGTLAANEVDQLRKMGQYNFGLTLTNLILVTLLMTPIIESFQYLLHLYRHTPVETLCFLAGVWAVCLTLAGLIIALILFWRRNNFRRLISELPEMYFIQEDGIVRHFTDSRKSSISWSRLDEWWVRESLLLISQKDTLDPMVLPLQDLSPADIQRLQEILRLHWKDETKAAI